MQDRVALAECVSSGQPPGEGAKNRAPEVCEDSGTVQGRFRLSMDRPYSSQGFKDEGIPMHMGNEQRCTKPKYHPKRGWIFSCFSKVMLWSTVISAALDCLMPVRTWRQATNNSG
eukprot:352887-Chlamydomonas_euryale.AAC.6